MRRFPVFGCLCLVLCIPLIVYADSEQTAQSDCKSLIRHSGFAEFVVPSEGGIQKLEVKVSPSVDWNVRNNNYVDWIEVLDGDSGVGPGTMTIQLEANEGRYCRVGTLTIVGVQPIFGNTMRIGSPIRILQRGAEIVDPVVQPNSSLPGVIYLAPFSSNNSQPPGQSGFRKVNKK